MSETGPIPDTKTCRDCGAAILWLWSPRVHSGRGGWVRFTKASEDGMTIRSHRCQPPRGEFSYQGGESPP
jgi:hypothetical protein